MNPQMISNPNMPTNINQSNVTNVPNISNVSSTPIVSGANNGPNMNVPNATVASVAGPTQMPGAVQMNTINQINPMINMQHMARGQPANVLFQGSESHSSNEIYSHQNHAKNFIFNFIYFILVRNTTPNQPYFRKSPSPSVPSPMGGGGGSLPNQMVPSPLVPSPQVTNIMTQRTGMWDNSIQPTQFQI